DADDVLRLAAIVEHEQRAAMRAAVLERVQRAVLVAGHHDRHRAERRRAIGAGSRELGFKAEKGPCGPAEYPLLLLLVEVAVGIDPIWHPHDPFGRPVPRLGFHGHDPLIASSLMALPP